MTSIRDVVVLKLQAQVLLRVTGVCAAYTCVVCACVCVMWGRGDFTTDLDYPAGSVLQGAMSPW